MSCRVLFTALKQSAWCSFVILLHFNRVVGGPRFFSPSESPLTYSFRVSLSFINLKPSQDPLSSSPSSFRDALFLF